VRQGQGVLFSRAAGARASLASGRSSTLSGACLGRVNSGTQVNPVPRKHTTPYHRSASWPTVAGVMRTKVDRNLLLASLLGRGFGRRLGGSFHRSLGRRFGRSLRWSFGRRFGSALGRDLIRFHFRHTFDVLMVNVNCLTGPIMPGLRHGSKRRVAFSENFRKTVGAVCLQMRCRGCGGSWQESLFNPEFRGETDFVQWDQLPAGQPVS